MRKKTFGTRSRTSAVLTPGARRNRIEGMPQLSVYIPDDETSSYAAFDILQDAAGKALIAWIGAFAHGGRPAQRQLTVVDATFAIVMRSDGQAGIAIIHKSWPRGMLQPDRGRGWVDSGVFDRKTASQMFVYLTEWLSEV